MTWIKPYWAGISCLYPDHCSCEWLQWY